MSQETMEWLNTMTLIGYTDQRGTAWHYRAEDQGERSNHYPGPVPMEDVVERLFGWKHEELPLYVAIPILGTDEFEYVELVDHKAIAANDDHSILGIFKDGYQGHDYEEWLLTNVANLLDADLGIGSAGLLRNRGVAFVTVEVPETLSKDGVEYRPHLLATTSFDGSIATTYKRNITLVVCDNTLSMALGEKSETYKLRHTKHSKMHIQDARSALNIIYQASEDFEKELDELLTWDISNKEFDGVLNILAPLPEDGNKRGTTVAIDKRNRLNELYAFDARVLPWHGTAFGVVQAFNTYSHHVTKVRKETNRGQRNMLDSITGKFEQRDREVIEALIKVTDHQLVTV